MNVVIKISYKKTGFLFLLLCTWEMGMTQSLSYKALSQELQSLQKQIVPDKRVAILEIELKDTLSPVVVVSGKTDLHEAKKQIIQFLTDQKVSFIDSIRLLPDSLLGDKTWALAKLSVSNIRILPKDASELVSQVMMGTPMKVLDYVDKWYLIQTPEHYIGWMDTSGLQTVTQKELDRWKGSNRCLYNRMSGFVYDLPGKKGEVISDIVLGDLFEVKSSVRGFLKIWIPDGRIGYVRKAECISFESWTTPEPKVQSVLSIARKMMGFPYLWGGASSKAVDCSGFVKLAYYTQGIILARDASQQATYGETIDFNNMNNLQPGDLLFFGSSSQHITHMGIYLADGNFIHASGMVRVNSIDPSDPGFIPVRKTVTARRIMNSLNTEGIVRVEDHPWYNIKH
jgi:gamma-D-glutamyl-L-lysine dipeptidyl-peptidase